MKPVQNKFHLDFLVSPQEEFAGVVARAVVEPSRDIESLRGRISAFEPRESARQALGRLPDRACRRAGEEFWERWFIIKLTR